MTLKVIGTGFGRTGTDSMREALDLLGFAPCHHKRALIEDAAHRLDWIDAFEGGPFDLDTLVGGYPACVDWPTAAFWPALVDAYPQAKVLLTWRTPESWWASFEKTILQVALKRAENPGPREDSIVIPLMKKVFGMPVPDRETALAAYAANVAKVKAEVPPERLLVYRVGDGWEPLCAHLGVAVPDIPFPHANTSADFRSESGLGKLTTS